MKTAIKLSDSLVEQARRHGRVYSRSAPKQIEYWTRIGRIVEENPDVPYSLIKDILLAKEEATSGDLTVYTFG